MRPAILTLLGVILASASGSAGVIHVPDPRINQQLSRKRPPDTDITAPLQYRLPLLHSVFPSRL